MYKVLFLLLLVIGVNANSLFAPQKESNVIDSKKQYELDKKRSNLFQNKTEQSKNQYNDRFQKILECEKNAKNDIEKEKCYGLNLKEKTDTVNTFNPEEMLKGVQKPKNSVDDISKFKHHKLTNEQLNQIKELQ